jgi:acetylornithine deacetylase/succinyl-diaminopimelate desuccinylase-like protein
MKEGKKTLLIYMHFDGQAVDNSKWNQEDPFKMVLKAPVDESWEEREFSKLDEELNFNWRLFGRSTSDDKGPIVMLLNAIDLLQEQNEELEYNIKVLLDSEEEKSSAPLTAALDTYSELFEADYLIIGDGPMHSSLNPTIVYGCRGITSLTLTAYGPKLAQHSGHFGNYAPNPSYALAHLLASFKDVSGKVLIDGYYEGIQIDEQTSNVLKAVPDKESDLLNRLVVKASEKVGSFYQESLQYPSLNIRGLASAWVGDNARTIVPATATAELDLRLVVESDGNRLKKLVRNHIAKQGYHIVDQEPTDQERKTYSNIIKIEEGGVMDAFRTDINHPFGTHLVDLMHKTFDKEVVQIRTMGGTVPIAPFVNKMKLPAFILPTVNADNNQHAPNENLRIGQIDYGIRLFYGLFSQN